MNDIRSRRNFLRGTAGAISGAALLPTDAAATGLNEPLSLEQAARALHETIGRHSAQNAQFFPESHYLPVEDITLKYAMEGLRFCSVDKIQHLLKPLFEGGAS